MKFVFGALVAVMAMGSLGCASRFSRVAPGMTGDEVVKAMESGPTRVVAQRDDYASWYYDGDGCLLMQGGRVVAKDVDKRRTGVATSVIGYPAGFSSRELAHCVPPGDTSAAPVETKVMTPIGGVRVQSP